MIFALLGGDERSVRLAGQLQRDGHEVRSFALEKALPNYSVSPVELFAGVDAIVFAHSIAKHYNYVRSLPAHAPSAMFDVCHAHNQ